MKLSILTFVLTVVTAMPALAESPSDWFKRFLDPKEEIGVDPYPASTHNRKITFDVIRKEGPGKRVAVYMAPDGQVGPASEHFQKALGIKPRITGSDSIFERHDFNVTKPIGKVPVGTTIVIMRSPWQDSKTQIQIEVPVPVEEQPKADGAATDSPG